MEENTTQLSQLFGQQYLHYKIFSAMPVNLSWLRETSILLLVNTLLESSSFSSCILIHICLLTDASKRKKKCNINVPTTYNIAQVHSNGGKHLSSSNWSQGTTFCMTVMPYKIPTAWQFRTTRMLNKRRTNLVAEQSNSNHCKNVRRGRNACKCGLGVGWMLV